VGREGVSEGDGEGMSGEGSEWGRKGEAKEGSMNGEQEREREM